MYYITFRSCHYRVLTIYDVTYKSDNDELLDLQAKWLDTHNAAVWHDLWLLSYAVCKRIVLHQMRLHKLYFTQEGINDKAVSACEYVLRRYKQPPRQHRCVYFVKSNFVATLHFGVIHAMYHLRPNDIINDNAISLDCV